MKLVTVKQRKKLLSAELARITEVLVRDYEPEKIILFGSLAKGHVHEWSDIDLFIIKKTTKRPIERTLEACRLIKPRIGIDLFIYNPEEFEGLIKEEFPFLVNIMKKGKVLYDKSI